MSPLERRQFLELHLQQKRFNYGWLEGCSQNPNAFPYRIKEEGIATVLPKTICPHPVEVTEIGSDQDPLYIVNIPMRWPREGQSAITRLTNILRYEGFGTTPEQSSLTAKRRLVVILGINQMDSIDKSVNREFRERVKSLTAVQGIACCQMGFRWAPQWTQKTHPLLYDPKKLYQLLKLYSNQAAQEVRRLREGDEKLGLNEHAKAQIPYQRIRERIKVLSVGVTNQLEPRINGPIYLGVMDDDMLRLRPDLGKGIFSRVDAIVRHQLPSVISLGYSVVNQPPLIYLGVLLDMKVREAVSSIFPFGVYYPEPCSFFRIRLPGNSNRLAQVSFVGGSGEKLESRRFIKSGLASGVFDNNGVYMADGGVLMVTPARMITQGNVNLTYNQIKQKRFLQALRGISQSHIDPLEWAGNLYLGLGIKANFRAIKSPLSHIFSVYDPISRMLSTVEKYSSKVFDSVMRDYLHGQWSDGLRNTLDTARAKLMLDFGLEKELVDRIEEAAKRSGLAIYNVLNHFR